HAGEVAGIAVGPRGLELVAANPPPLGGPHAVLQVDAPSPNRVQDPIGQHAMRRADHVLRMGAVAIDLDDRTGDDVMAEGEHRLGGLEHPLMELASLPTASLAVVHIDVLDEATVDIVEGQLGPLIVGATEQMRQLENLLIIAGHAQAAAPPLSSTPL